MADSYALEARKISKWFGPHQALKGVSLNIREGEVHGVIGENGAGKSTLMNILSGKLTPDEGELYRDGQKVLFSQPIDARHAGISMAPQEPTLCSLLTVAENIALGAQSLGRFGIDWDEMRRRSVQRLAELDEDISPDIPVGKLNASRQQVIQVIRATPDWASIIVFDEPTSSLTMRETSRLFTFIDALRAKGRAIFYISHRLDEVLRLADRISVLRDGELVAELNAKQTDRDEMIRHMAGRTATRAQQTEKRPQEAGNPVVLKVAGLSRENEFQDINFDLREGEILGVSGLVGSGRTELGKCLFGVTKPDSGTIEIKGKITHNASPVDAIANGLVYLPEDRKKEGIFPILSAAENICVADLGAFRSMLGLSWGRMVAAATDYARRLGIRVESPRQTIMSLSGGNQQKAILARWLMRRCNIMVLDEPTRGIDVNAKFEIQQLLRRLTEEGLSIIYISSEMKEILDIADRVLVMSEGRMKGIVDPAKLTQEALLQMEMT
jgi:ABC-type sugar transport system ATPase subunit